MNSNLTGEQLRKLRVLKGLNQKDLAKRAGLSESTISAVESGSRGFKLSTIDRMCRALGTTPEALLSDLQAGDLSAPDPEIEAQYKECLDQALAGVRALLLFHFSLVGPRVRRGTSGVEIAKGVRVRVRPTRKKKVREKGEKRP